MLTWITQLDNPRAQTDRTVERAFHHAGFSVFLSGVSSEFGVARSALASDLRARGLEVKVQEDFRQEAQVETTLAKLHRYIAGCDAVVAIMGTRSGSLPPPAVADPFRQMLPTGIAEASYTQWDILVAQHYKRRPSIYVADAAWQPDRPDSADPDGPELQAALRHYLFREQGLDRVEGFASDHQLCRQVLREDWPDRHAAKTGSPALPHHRQPVQGPRGRDGAAARELDPQRSHGDHRQAAGAVRSGGTPHQ